ncbi:unnamed protein product [Phyllotreta striolata]|uniref:Multidrug resistance-associated protein lethal(2)03659 n=1 Tax=Phyllotreta striolata TaxID=444603 RepID=A0A9N9TA61_PHYSR|nr:unnamed protein product [Phyllotreta striolata]
MEEIGANVSQKKTNPRERTNIISNAFFCWLLPYFVKGYRRDLTEDDMYKHRNQHDSGVLGSKVERRWNNHVKKNKNPSYARVLLGTFFLEIAALNVLAILFEGIKMVQPFLIKWLIANFESGAPDKRDDIYLYSGLIVLTQLLAVLINHRFNLAMMQVGMKLRICSCSLIYRKALKLSKSSLAETTVGQMVNLLSNDVGRFDQAVHLLHYFYFAPIQTLIVMYLLYVNVGVASLGGVVFLLLGIPFQSWLGKKTSQFRLSTAGTTDERVRLMNEIISGIQVIKMYTWEYPFAKLVEYARMKEMKYIRLTSRVRGILMSMALTTNRCAIALSIIIYSLTGNTVNATYTYTVISFYELLYTLTMFFPVAVSQGSEMLISMKRIQQFLMYEELKFDDQHMSDSLMINGKESDKKPMLKGPDASIRIKNASAKWLKSLPENCLDEIDLHIKGGECVAVVGPVGSGKSTLLHIIMRELELQSGSVSVKGTISYASQEPWLFGGSVRQNILFGQKFEQKKYEEVVRVCALQRDFSLFPHGDRTLVGDRGVTLSGGQKARINLARAVYKEADIYLLDDPLSAVDAHVGKQLFEDCIIDYLHNKIVVLVTHQLQYLKNVKTIYLMKDGRIEVSGSYEDLKNSKTEYSNLLANIEEEEEAVRRKSRQISEKVDEDEFDYEIQIQEREGKGSGKISNRVYMNYAKSGGHIIKVFLIAFTFIISQLIESCCEYYVTFWVNINQWKFQTADNVSSNSSTDVFILIILLVVTVITRSLTFYAWCIIVSMNLHNKMFINIVYSPMKFFNLNPTGRILNRFSKDIGLIDELLPMTLLDTVQAQEILKDEFDKYQNLHSAAFFMYLAVNRTFGFWLDFICVIYIALVIVALLFLKNEQFGGNMGLALTQAMALTGMFQWGMRQWTELENQMTSVERVQEYTELKHEEDNATFEPPSNWPSNGEVEFKNMSLQYSLDDPPVLKNLSFLIKAKEKVGIVGRTGAGKSSLIQALFRLTNIDGQIYIDGIDTKSVSLKKLRSNISIIPQEPVLFSGTLRKNLDPFDEYKDEVLWDALSEVELKSAVEELPAGLESKMAEGGSNFSVGQRQLVCLARAIIRNNKILVLDEATANVDPHTDGLIQTAIRTKFANCTVLTIAHRLHTIMDSDKVLVMDAGRAVEFDHPHTLLQKERGIFYSLVQQTGKATAKNLTAIAANSYNATLD